MVQRWIYFNLPPFLLGERSWQKKWTKKEDAEAPSCKKYGHNRYG